MQYGVVFVEEGCSNPSRACFEMNRWNPLILSENSVEGRNICEKALSARAGIRTRVDGMKTRNDGPDYTTRAVIRPPSSAS